MKLHLNVSLALLALCLASAFSGCHNEDKPKAVAPVRVTVLTVGDKSSGSAISYSGTIIASKTIDLSFQVSGTVMSIPVETGQFVKKGQLIAQIDETVYRNQYNAQLAQANLAKENYQRIAEVFKKGSIAEIKMIEARANFMQASSAAKATYQNILHTRLYASQSGYIGDKKIEAGATAGPGVPIVQLLNISPVKVNVAIPESEINSFKKGDKANVTVQALQNKQIAGVVDEVAVISAQGIPTYTVKVSLPNQGNQLKPGMVCTILFKEKMGAKGNSAPTMGTENAEEENVGNTEHIGKTGSEASANGSIVIPVQSVQIDENNRNFVFIGNAQGNKAIRKDIVTGDLFNNGVSVVSGLHKGDRLIVSGYHKLTNDTPIQIVK